MANAQDSHAAPPDEPFSFEAHPHVISGTAARAIPAGVGWQAATSQDIGWVE